MQAGIIYGYVGMVERLINMIKEELGNDDVKVIATGGLSTLIDSETDSIDYIDKDLTLEGLKLIYEKNINRYKNKSFSYEDNKII